MHSDASGQCRHETPAETCWYCLSISDQDDNRVVWDRIASDPLFGKAMADSEEELKSGKVIRLKRSEAGDKPYVFTHSSFRQLIDIIHDDKMRREGEIHRSRGDSGLGAIDISGTEKGG